MEKIITTKETTARITEGINRLADVVKITLGGKGKNVIINDGFNDPKIINDGVTIAQEVELKDEVENTGALLAKKCANKTNEEAGDGTTTTIVLLQAFLQELDSLEISDVRQFRDEVEKKLKKVVEYLDKNKREVGDDDLFRIAKNSSLDEQIAKTITEVIEKVGKDGLVSIEDGQKVGITYEIVNGIKIDDGYISPYMITNQEKMRAELKDDVPILMTRKDITSMTDILPVLEGLQARGKNEIVIFTEDIIDDVLAPLVINKMQGRFTAVVVKTNNMEDIATITGAKIVSSENGLQYTEEVLGYAGRVEVGKHYTLVSNGKAPKKEIEKRIEELMKARENAEEEEDKIRLSQSIAKLQNGVATIKIAGENEVQTKEKKLKLEDALHAVKSAMEEGIIEGGGMALLRASEEVLDDSVAGQFVSAVIRQPFYQILANADEQFVPDLEKHENEGYNVVTRRWENFYETGVIDPVKVVKRSLINAFATGTSITTARAGIIVKNNNNGQTNQP